MRRGPIEEEGSEARITLRLPESLKAAIDGAAAREGLSVNTWLLQVLTRSQVTDIYVLGRRGPVQAKFTPQELKELGELPSGAPGAHELSTLPRAGCGVRGRP